MVTERADRTATRGVVWQPQDRRAPRSSSRAAARARTLAVAGIAVVVYAMALLLLLAMLVPRVG